MVFGPSISAPAIAALPQHKCRCHTVSSSGLVFSLLSQGSDFLPGKRGFLFKIHHLVGLVTANNLDLLS